MELSNFLISLVTVSCLVWGLIYWYIEKKYRIVSESNLPKNKSFWCPFGSWFGIWNKVLGNEDVKHLRQYGKLYWTFDGIRPNLFVANPDLVKIILSEKANDFESFRACSVNNDVLSKSLEIIEKRNEKTKEIFDQKNIKKLIPRIERSAEALVQELKKKSENIFIQQNIMQYIGDVIAMTVFGIDLYSDEYKDQRQKFMENINRVFRVSNPTSISSVFPYAFKKLRLMGNGILPSESVAFFSELCATVLDSKMSVANIEIESKGIDVIDLLIEKFTPKKTPSEEVVGQVKEQYPVVQEIVAECLSIILYTVRSTEATLSEAIHILSNSEEEQNKLHNEVGKINFPSGEKYYAQPSLEAQYLDMFLKEIQRLYPIELRLTRQTKTTVELGDITLPADFSVSIPIYAIHRLAEFFPEPLEFKPDRFSEENVKKIKDSTYLPYGQAASNTSFVGFQLYNLFCKIALAYVFMNFKILQPVPQLQAPITFTKGATEVPVLMPVIVKLEKRS